MTQCPHVCSGFHLTLDLDERVSPPEIVPTALVKPSCYHWRLSAGGKGIHVLACVPSNDNKELNAAWAMHWRLANHDDPSRWKADWNRFGATLDTRYIMGVIWDYKNGSHAGEWQDIKRRK